MSVRSLRRLMRSWQEQGIAGLTRQSRSDQGSSKSSEDWQTFILKTYREGNRGSRSLTPAQVAFRVRARAQELGVEDYRSAQLFTEFSNPKSRNSNRNGHWAGVAIDCASPLAKGLN